jgi:hypothetical protein
VLALACCPFDESDKYEKNAFGYSKCRGKCNGDIEERKYCPACKGMHTFTVLDDGRLGCWNEKCSKRIFVSKAEFNNYDKTPRNGNNVTINFF